MDELLTVHILLGPNYRFDGAVQDAQVCQLLSRLILQIDHSLIPVIPIGLANNETLIPLHHERCLREQGIDETCEMVVTAAAPLRSQYITPIECQSDLRLYYQLPILKSYLLKKGDKGLLKTWKKRWFELKGKLLYYSESEESSVFINAINLHTMQYVCVGRSSLETPRGYGNCVFQVVTLHRIYHLIAPTEQERDRWVSMLSQIRRVFDATIGPPGSYTSESEGLGLSQHLRSTQDLDDQSLHFWGSQASAANIPTTLKDHRPRTTSIRLYGYLWKRGDVGLWKSWKRRFFIMEGFDLAYYVSEDDGNRINSVNLKQVERAYIYERADITPPIPKAYMFALEVPGRTYYFVSETEMERTRWLAVVDQVLARRNHVEIRSHGSLTLQKDEF